MGVAEHALLVHVDQDVALAQHTVLVGATVRYDVFYLQEVVAGLVGADDGEAEAVHAFLQPCFQELTVELGGVARELRRRLDD